ncbi:MAG TPA: DMT family transporter [Vitreimonas sp.]|nr:DMT family transporter [Vitreimonas sp.]
MSWIVPALGMFACSALMYTIIRKTQLLGVPSAINNLAMFLIPLPFNVVYVWWSGESLTVSIYQLALMVFTALFLSWLGNIASLKAIALAPNPGYSLIISKSYVVLTAIASIWLFAAPLPLKSVLAIAMIVAFSGLIIINKDVTAHKTESSSWVGYSLLAFVCWAGLALMSKYLLNLGVSVSARLLYVFVIVAAICLIEVKRQGLSLRLSYPVWRWLLLNGLFQFLFNLFMQIGYQLSPNPGYINAVNAASIVLLTLLSAWLFKDELTQRKLIGVVGVTLGLIVLFL